MGALAIFRHPALDAGSSTPEKHGRAIARHFRLKTGPRIKCGVTAFCWRVGALLLAVILAAPAAAQETLEFPTATYANFGDLLSGAGQPQTGRGILRLPEGGTGKAPLVVIAHTIGGWSDSNEGWFGRELSKKGYAAFEIDTFGPRNVRNVATEGGAWSNPTETADAYRALAALAAHPRIDARRAALIGFSLGGDVTHAAAMAAVADRLAPDGPRFAAHVAFYPPCSQAGNPYGDGYTGAPVLFLLAEKDDSGSPAKCRSVPDEFRKLGKAAPVDIVIYPGAYHNWTNSAGPVPPRFNPNLASSNYCGVLLFGPGGMDLRDGVVQRVDPKQRAACLARKGYSLGYSAETRARSFDDLLAFLGKTL